MMGQLYEIVAFLLVLATLANGDITGMATCDNQMVMYADGNQVAESNDWETASSVTLHDCTQVVAIYCHDLHVVSGIRAYFSNGIQTDETWQCSTTYHPGWNTTGFTPGSGWFSATEVSDTSPWGNKPYTMPQDQGKWIWSNAEGNGPDDLYCRKEFPEKDCCCCEVVKNELQAIRTDMETGFANILQMLEKFQSDNSVANGKTQETLTSILNRLYGCCPLRPSTPKERPSKPLPLE